MNLAKMVAAGGPLEVGGRTFLCSPLSISDMGEIQAWVISHSPDLFKLAAKAITELHPLKEADPEQYRAIYRELVMAAYNDAKAVEGIDIQQALDGIFRTTAGIVFVIYVIARRKHPELTIETLNALIGQQSAQEFMTQLAGLKQKVTETALAGMEEVEEILSDPFGPKEKPPMEAPSIGPESSITSRVNSSGPLSKSAI